MPAHADVVIVLD